MSIDTEAKTTEQPTTAELTISDLNAVKSIIDVASSRGAFKPTEMVTVGQTYIKLVAFLDQVGNLPAEGAA